MTNDYRERLDQAIQTALVTLLKYPPSGVRVDRAYGGSCDVTFTLPDAYSAQVLGPLYATMYAHEPPTPPAEKLPEGWVCEVSGRRYSRRLPASAHNVVVALDTAGYWRCFDTKPGTVDWFQMPDSATLPAVLVRANQEREARFVQSFEKKLVVPPYGATCANGPPQGSMYRGWLSCGSDETSGRFYRRTGHASVGTCTVAWEGIGWVLHWGERHHDTYMGVCSLDEALDRAKEMMG